LDIRSIPVYNFIISASGSRQITAAGLEVFKAMKTQVEWNVTLYNVVVEQKLSEDHAASIFRVKLIL
jgi:hypothetical protein